MNPKSEVSAIPSPTRDERCMSWLLFTDTLISVMALLWPDKKRLSFGRIRGAANSENPMRSHYFFLSLAGGLPVWIIVFYCAYLEVLQPPEIEHPLSVLAAVVLFPILEELVFRGLLWDLWDYFKRVKSSYLGMLAVKNCCISVCFSMLHIFNFGLLGGFLVFIPSLWLGWLKDRSGSTKTCCLVHILWNAGFVAAAVMGDRLTIN